MTPINLDGFLIPCEQYLAHKRDAKSIQERMAASTAFFHEVSVPFGNGNFDLEAFRRLVGKGRDK